MASDYRGQTTLPRGIRNNNPGNIKPVDANGNRVNWQGMAGDDGTFAIFTDMSWGTRAVGQSLINMINKGYNTIDTLIRQWSATDQDAYVTDVSSDTGIDSGAQLGTDATTIAALIRAISNQENGDGPSYQYVLDSDIADGISKINSGLITSLQAAAISVGQNPEPYLIGIALVFATIWYISGRRKG